MAALQNIKLITGNANPQLAEKIARYLEVDLVSCQVGRFNDGEVQVKMEESVRGGHAFVLQPTSPPVNDNLMELLIIIDALRRASVNQITAVLPYFGYARQDRKTQPRDPVSAKLVANLITASGADRVVSIDLHAPQIQGFFDLPFDNLLAEPIFVDYFRQKSLEDVVVVAPDVGAVKEARRFAAKLKVPMAIIDKRRPEPNRAEVMNIIGQVKGKNVIIRDDIIDTGGTLTEGAAHLKEAGCERVIGCCTHPILSGPARERLSSGVFDEIVFSDTIPLDWDDPKVKILSVDKLLGEAIDRISKNISVSALFY